MTTDPIETPDPTDGRPFEELIETGLLWLINTSVLHPRGYALAIHFDESQRATGWSILGDGTTPWTMPNDQIINDLFAKIRDLLP